MDSEKDSEMDSAYCAELVDQDQRQHSPRKRTLTHISELTEAQMAVQNICGLCGRYFQLSH